MQQLGTNVFFGEMSACPFLLSFFPFVAVDFHFNRPVFVVAYNRP